MPTVRPGSVEELAEALRAGGSAPVGVVGGGSKRSWGGVRAQVAQTVSTASLDRVLEHAIGDFVVTVEAGTPLAEVQRVVGEHRQWLALDPPEPDATIGGVVATAAAGPRRLRFGTPRDLVLGLTVVLADGTVARAGGKVVKNVAGYDLGKLFCGSFGTLGVIASVTLRLHPAPRSTRMVSVSTDDPAPVIDALRRTSVRPSAVEYDGAAVHVVVEAFESAAQSQADQLTALLGGSTSDRLPESFGARPWTATNTGLKLTHRLGAFGAVVRQVRAVAPRLRLTAHAMSGVVSLGGDVDAALLAELRALAAAYDGTVVVASAPDDVKAGLDVWGPVAGVGVMRRVKAQFDPDARMNPGVFVDGI